MVGKTSARNQTNNPGNATRVQGRMVSNVTPIYTVPAGKTARLSDLSMEVVTIGADATYALAIKRVGGTFDAISRFVDATGGQNITEANLVVLTAGEGLSNVGDSGSTNGTVEIAATVEEFTA